MTFDRDNARALIAEARELAGRLPVNCDMADDTLRDLADALEAALTPPRIDRDALAEALMQVYDHGTAPNAVREADAVIAHLSAYDLNTEQADRVEALSAVPVEGDPSQEFMAKVERSSLGTPEAQALRATVSDEKAAELVRRSEASRPFTEEDVEAAASAAWSSLLNLPWVEATERSANDYRNAARAALDAVTARHTKGDKA